MVTNEYLRLIASGSLIVNQLIDALSHGWLENFENLKKVLKFYENYCCRHWSLLFIWLQKSFSVVFSVHSTVEIIFILFIYFGFNNNFWSVYLPTPGRFLFTRVGDRCWVGLLTFSLFCTFVDKVRFLLET